MKPRFPCVFLVPAVLALCLWTGAQQSVADDGEPLRFTSEELQTLVGPVALYPDVILASLMPACTHPGDVAQAAQYVTEQGGKASTAPEGSTWDTSVVALLQYPDVLAWLMSNKDWMQQMGTAVSYQQSDVMAAIQAFRQAAMDAGNLTSNEQQTVSTEDVSGGTTEVIVIAPTNPQVVYVPTYSTAAVVQPGYVGWGWGAGFVMGAAAATAYHSIHWDSHGGSINVNNSVNVNTGNVNVNRGNVNTGNINTGNVNRGNVNTGNVNTGNVNRGNVNTGNVNTGNVNRGNANAGNGSASNMGPNRSSAWQSPKGAGAGSAAGAPRSSGQVARPSTPPSHSFGGSGSGSQARQQSERGASSLRQSGGGAGGSEFRGQSGRSSGANRSAGGRSGGGRRR